MSMARWEKELVEEFKKFFSLLGKSEEEIEKIFEGVSGIDLKNPTPRPPGERAGHSSPQQSWGVFWNILIKNERRKK